ncbi:MAG: DUF354 domain-containing protein [Acidobacteria bacterium]|nr:MAG: DUF354 domain-containing protein [Acidobacteriota bacterium]
MQKDGGRLAPKLTSQASQRAKIWIDLDNSPHVPFFVPIIKELEELGYPVVLTARDCFQVRDLVSLFNLRCKFVGRHYGKHKLAKIAGTLLRGLQLAILLRGEKARLAVAHGSRAQTVAATLLGIPSLCLWDYEFTKGIGKIRPDWVMVPAVIPDSAIHADTRRVFKYQGIKEDVYVPGFRPDPSLRSRLGLKEDDFVVTARPPADEAHYYNPESDELFRAAIDFLAEQHRARIILLPRNEKQCAAARALWPELVAGRKMIIPEHAVDGLSLLWSSDLAISGGGTMNREAAALGVPVYSVFRGKIGAVDRYLAQNGRLVLLEKASDVREKIIVPQSGRKRAPANRQSYTLKMIVDNLVAIVETGRFSPKVAA